MTMPATSWYKYICPQDGGLNGPIGKDKMIEVDKIIAAIESSGQPEDIREYAVALAKFKEAAGTDRMISAHCDYEKKRQPLIADGNMDRQSTGMALYFLLYGKSLNDIKGLVLDTDD